MEKCMGFPFGNDLYRDDSCSWATMIFVWSPNGSNRCICCILLHFSVSWASGPLPMASLSFDLHWVDQDESLLFRQDFGMPRSTQAVAVKLWLLTALGHFQWQNTCTYTHTNTNTNTNTNTKTNTNTNTNTNTIRVRVLVRVCINIYFSSAATACSTWCSEWPWYTH